MDQAWIDGTPVALTTAATAAARLLDASRQTLIAGLGTDVAGARAAIALARRVGAVVDHMHGEALMRDLDVVRETGAMLITPSEARARADTLFLVGPGLDDDDVVRHVLDGDARRIIRLAGTGEPDGDDVRRLPALLAAVRAHINGRPVGTGGPAFRQKPDQIATELKAAAFGVALWSASTLDELTIEMLCGIVDDLNATTRFSGLAIPAGDNAIGVQQVCGWTMGFPVRTTWGRGCPEHDPWQYRAARLVESGETDCVVWISAYRNAVPTWSGDPPTIALAPAGTRFAGTPRIHIAVGAPGRDHDSVVHHTRLGSFAALSAAHPSEALSVAAAIASIDTHLTAGPTSC